MTISSAGHCCDKVATKDITMDITMQHGESKSVQVLVDKLKNGGRLIIPVGKQDAVQVKYPVHTSIGHWQIACNHCLWLQQMYLSDTICRQLSC